jgi:hypothetical protein
MRFVKAFGVGLLVAVVSIAIGLAVKLAAATLYFRWVVLPREQAKGNGGIGSVSVLVSGWELIAVGAIGFVLGLWWMLQRRQPAST